MATRPVHLTNRRGRTLAAKLETPDAGPPHATALLAHCFTCGKDLKGLVRLSRTLTDHGFAVLRVDFTGLGESDGDVGEAGLGGDADDLLDAAAWLETEIAAPALLVGHSLGGLAAILAAPKLPSLRALATIGAPSDPEHVLGLVAVDPATLEADGRAETTLAGRTFTLPRRFFDDLAARDPLAVLRELRVPLLVLHAVTDAIVGVRHAQALFEAAHDPRKSYVSLGQADHLLSRDADARFAGHMLGAWAASLVEMAGDRLDVHAPATDAPRLPERVSRAVTGAGYATDAWAGGHPLRVDEPLTAGGTDTGGTPVDLVRTALAACTSITLRMYADRKGWPLDRIEVDVTSSSERKDGEVHTHYVRRITLVGDLDDDQRARAIEIADRCPVHRSLEGPTTIDTVEV